MLRVGAILLVLLLTMGLAARYAWKHRDPIKILTIRVVARLARPFVRHITDPEKAAQDQTNNAIRIELQQLQKTVQDLQQTAQDLQRQTSAKTESWSAVAPQEPIAFGEAFVPVMSLLDQTSLYTKGDRVEIYGANLEQSRSGPVLINQSTLHVGAQRAALAWWPRYSTATRATHLKIRLSPTNRAINGKISVEVQFADDYTQAFSVLLGAPAPTLAQPDTTQLPPDIAALSGTTNQSNLVAVADGFIVPLPSEVRTRLQKLGENAVRLVTLRIEDAAGTDIQFSDVAFVRQRVSWRKSATLYGSVVAAPLPPGSVVQLLNRNGTSRYSVISAVNTFVFENVPLDEPVSVRFNVEDQDYFADQGRWIVPVDDMFLRIHVEPLYINKDNHPADPTKGAFVGISAPNLGAAFYQPHSRQYWPGATPVQAYDSHTFTNNWGFVDRDRFEANPDHCFRVVHLGSSHAVALQVPISQKYNILLEEDLGLKLNRCVEVISAGRDNGDIGSNYPRVRDYAVRFKPDLILIEVNTSLTMQLHPFFSKHGLGWDPEKSALDNFFYNADHRLQFRPFDPNYNLHTTPPEYPEIVPGVRYFDTLKIEWNALPHVAVEDFGYMADIAKYFDEKFPAMRFVLHDGLDQAQCKASCDDRLLKKPDGTTFKVGPAQFRENFKKVCADNGLECLDLPFRPSGADPLEYLTWYLDGHYNIRGHQWLARQLADQITEKLLSKEGASR